MCKVRKSSVTVVIPFYKGNRYLSYWIKKLKNNIENLQKRKLEISCEVLFVNDYPEEELLLAEEVPENMNLKIYNLSQNRGIHGARVFGYQSASGEYIVFLDQDDKISDNYLISQLEHINANDAVVSNGYYERFCMSGRRILYKDVLRHQEVMDVESYIKIGNRIMSPGQVLMRREAIPKIWINNIMQKNGADDYLLWILMLKANRRFCINETKLYTHVGHGENVSSNKIGMRNSVDEMIRVLEKNKVLDKEESQAIRMRNQIASTKTDKFYEMMLLYDYWMSLKINNRNLAQYFEIKGYYKVAVYGMNYLGSRFCDELEKSKIRVLFGIDKEARGIEHTIPIYEMEEAVNYMHSVDVIVVTAISFYKEIALDIKARYEIPVISLKDVIVELCNEA